MHLPTSPLLPRAPSAGRHVVVTATLVIALAGCARPPAPTNAPPPATAGGAASAPGAATRYTILAAGHPAGFQAVTRRPDGTITIHVEYNDRGRGPRTDTELRLDRRGLPVALRSSGHDYYKKPIGETLARDGDRLRWKTHLDAGEGRADAFYLSAHETPEERAVLARALLAAPGGRLPLLPGGHASIRRVGELELEANGGRRTVTHVEIDGLGLAPNDLWLDADGSLFAEVTAWFSTVREGWETTAPRLLARQGERARARAVAIARRVAHRPPGGRLAIRGAAVFDSERGVLRRGRTILVRGDRIERVAPDGSFRLPEGTQVIDARGKTVLPGLWDLHVHFFDDADGLLFLAAGVTTVRDLGNEVDRVLGLERRIAEGEVVGPRILRAGFLDGVGPYAAPISARAATEAEARRWIDRYAKLGFVQIKLYSSLDPAMVPNLVRYAHDKGLLVSGHIPAGMIARQAVEAGYDEIQHANMLFLNFMPDVKETRTPARFTEVARRGGDLDLKSPEVRAFVRLLATRGVAVDPTLIVFERQFLARPGVVAPGWSTVAHRLPGPFVRRELLDGGLPVPPGMEGRHRAAFRKMLDLVGRLHQAGVPILPGTDDFPVGIALHRELELYAAAGIPAAEVLQLATLKAARHMKRDRDLGSIAPGKLADLVIIDGNPVADISAIRRVETTIRGGVVYRADELYPLAGVAPDGPPDVAPAR